MKTSTTEVADIIKDDIAEKQMGALGLRWDIEKLPLKNIHASDFENFSRPRGTDKSEIESLQAAYERRDPVPAIVVAKDGGKFRIIGGHHRSEGARLAGLESVWCYIVDGKKESLRQLAGMLNAIGISATPTAFRIESAIAAINLGESERDAAAFYNVSLKALRATKRVSEVDTVLAKNAISPSRLAKGVKARLKNLDPDVMAEAAKNIITSKKSLVEAEAFIRRIEEQKTHCERMSAIAEANKAIEKNGESPSEAPVAGVKRPAKSRFWGAVGVLEDTLSGVRSLSQLGIVKDENNSTRISKLSQKLSRIASL